MHCAIGMYLALLTDATSSPAHEARDASAASAASVSPNGCELLVPDLWVSGRGPNPLLHLQDRSY